jgi:cytochrome c2
MIKHFIIIAACMMSFMTSFYVYAIEGAPTLTIESPSKQFSFSRTALFSMQELTQVSMSYNRAYPNVRMTYTAIKLCDLLRRYSIKSTDMLEFIAADHFSVLIPATKIIHCSNRSAIGYLAIEPLNKWPLLNNNTGTTAGPFDVIWVHPEKSYISNEYWSWSVVKIKIHKKLDNKVFLAAPEELDQTIKNNIKNGYDVYISHCAGCHSINHIGKGVIGPDLNIPKNPVEYYPNDTVLKKFIRDPQSVRVIKNDRMSGSNKQFLSDADLDDLILYLHYMANNPRIKKQ